jgi:transaldolase
MGRQARQSDTFGPDVYVKIPVANTNGESAALLVRQLTQDNIKLNVTAILTLDQVHSTVAALEGSPSAYVSVLAGRIADAGVDPRPIMKGSLALMKPQPRLELIWASPREVFNQVQADGIGCHIITITHELLKKLKGPCAMQAAESASSASEYGSYFYNNGTIERLHGPMPGMPRGVRVGRPCGHAGSRPHPGCSSYRIRKILRCSEA